MIDTAAAHRLRSDKASVLDPAREKVGTVAEFFLDDVTGEPTWVVVAGGLLGSVRTLVPLQGARLADGDLVVAYGKDLLEEAPRLTAQHSLTPEDEATLWAYWSAPERADD